MDIFNNSVMAILQATCNTWNNMLTNITGILETSPEDFQYGAIWNIMSKINGAFMAIGIALVIVFFFMGLASEMSSFAELKRPEKAIIPFVRLIISEWVIINGLDLMKKVISITQGMMDIVLSSAGINVSGQTTVIPDYVVNAFKNNTDFFGLIPLNFVCGVSMVIVTVLSWYIFLIIYGRFFKMYIYTAISPIPLSTFAGKPTSDIGKHFSKAWCGVCLEGVIMIICLVIFSAFMSGNAIDLSSQSDSPIVVIWEYVGTMIFNMLILISMLKGADKLVSKIMAL